MKLVKKMGIFTVIFFILLCQSSGSVCNGNGGKKLKYLSGDALSDRRDCIGPEGKKYPSEAIERMLPKITSSRTGRSFGSRLVDPSTTRNNLLKAYSLSRDGISFNNKRQKRETNETSEATTTTTSNIDVTTPPVTCDSGDKTPARLCQSTFNTTAPMYGVSLTSGEPVTIVQKFPDLLQQVVYETCDSKECDLVHGECIQTYIPYLFLVIPLGPVTLTGQDYVLVESGCTCRPKYAQPGSDPNPTSVIPNFG